MKKTSAIIIKYRKNSLICSAKIESPNQRLPRIGLGEYSSLYGTFLGHQRQQLPGHSDGIATAGELQVLFRHPSHGAACLSQIELQNFRPPSKFGKSIKVNGAGNFYNVNMSSCEPWTNPAAAQSKKCLRCVQLYNDLGQIEPV